MLFFFSAYPGNMGTKALVSELTKESGDSGWYYKRNGDRVKRPTNSWSVDYERARDLMRKKQYEKVRLRFFGFFFLVCLLKEFSKLIRVMEDAMIRKLSFQETAESHIMIGEAYCRMEKFEVGLGHMRKVCYSFFVITVVVLILIRLPSLLKIQRIKLW